MNRVFAILFLSMSASLWASPHGEKTPLSLSGVIYEDESGKAAEGAVITLEKNGEVIQHTETDDQGNFILRMEGPVDRMDQLLVRIHKKGYKSTSLRPVEWTGQNLQIRLKRMPVVIPILKPMGGNPGISI